MLDLSHSSLDLDALRRLYSDKPRPRWSCGRSASADLRCSKQRRLDSACSRRRGVAPCGRLDAAGAGATAAVRRSVFGQGQHPRRGLADDSRVPHSSHLPDKSATSWPACKPRARSLSARTRWTSSQPALWASAAPFIPSTRSICREFPGAQARVQRSRSRLASSA